MTQGSPLEHFAYDAQGRLRARGRPMSEIVAACGTPTYVYDADAIRSRYHELTKAFEPIQPEVRFAAKACGNLSILRTLVELGAGVDVVSGGEVERSWASGCPMELVCFAGVGKTDGELRAALDGRYSPLRDGFNGLNPEGRGPIGLFNVESADELTRLDAVARELGVTARCALRIKPLVDAKTHDYTSTGRLADKFGVDLEDASGLFARFNTPKDAPGVRLIGLHAHIGSPVNTTEPFVESARVLANLAASLRDEGRVVELINLGGGWGTAYKTGEAPDLQRYAAAIEPPLSEELRRGTRILIEPGRTLVANAGVLLVSVTAVKRTGGRRFVVLDAGMNALIRPSLYGAFHFAWPIDLPREAVPQAATEDAGHPNRFEPADLVGPICESGDFLARGRPFPEVHTGDVVAVFSAGAYGMSMSSNYNDHAQPAEVLLDGEQVIRVRRRESIVDLLLPETEPVELTCKPRLEAQ